MAKNHRQGLLLGRVWAGAPAADWLIIALGVLLSIPLYWPDGPMSEVPYFIWPYRAFVGVEMCWAVYRVWRCRRARVVHQLYREDIFDGVCPDRGSDINSKNAWAWYRRQGSPKTITRQRPCRYTRDPAVYE
ncbi:hypothetical protein ACFFJT_10515 [Dyella flava]|uniref:Uncharacterized protein n=1 Tax=Dyella flava TaxID=1920170 RepID=A0ABS2K2D7_9GAMM|nr:hypothetical protein [Dyella flava]MBM7125225.1 hypothetical protein [Dyella flava]